MGSISYSNILVLSIFAISVTSVRIDLLAFRGSKLAYAYPSVILSVESVPRPKFVSLKLFIFTFVRGIEMLFNGVVFR